MLITVCHLYIAIAFRLPHPHPHPTHPLQYYIILWKVTFLGGRTSILCTVELCEWIMGDLLALYIFFNMTGTQWLTVCDEFVQVLGREGDCHCWLCDEERERDCVVGPVLRSACRSDVSRQAVKTYFVRHQKLFPVCLCVSVYNNYYSYCYYYHYYYYCTTTTITTD